MTNEEIKERIVSGNYPSDNELKKHRFDITFPLIIERKNQCVTYIPDQLIQEIDEMIERKIKSNRKLFDKEKIKRWEQALEKLKTYKWLEKVDRKLNPIFPQTIRMWEHLGFGGRK